MVKLGILSSLFILFIFIIVIFMIKNKVSISLTSLFKKGFKIKKDTYGVYCWTGKQGSGKTASCLTWIYNVKNKNTKVITNVKSFADNNKDFVIYNDNFYDIIAKFKNGTYDTNYFIFFDEIFTLLEKGKLDRSILSFISQLRKRKIYLLTTAQEWLEINVTFRRYVRYQIDCSIRTLPFCKTAFFVNKINDGYSMRWDNLQNEYVSDRIKTSIRKGSKKVVDSYDTFEVIKDC